MKRRQQQPHSAVVSPFKITFMRTRQPAVVCAPQQCLITECKSESQNVVQRCAECHLRVPFVKFTYWFAALLFDRVWVVKLPACRNFSSEQAKGWEKNTQISFSTAPGRNCE